MTRRQGGFAGLALLVVLLAAVGVLAFSVQTRTLDLLGHTQADLQARRLDRLAADVADFYRRSAAALDTAVAAPLGCAQVLAAASPVESADLTTGARLQCAIGTRRQTADGSLAWRSIWFWLPDPNAAADASVYDATTDVLTPAPGVIWRQVDGRGVQMALLNASFDRLDQIAAHLERYYQARTASAGSFDAGANFWVQAPCAGVPAAALAGAPACTQGAYVAAAPALAATGLPASLGFDAWGGNLEFLNSGADVAATAPPFAARLRLTTPWGFVYTRDLDSL